MVRRPLDDLYVHMPDGRPERGLTGRKPVKTILLIIFVIAQRGKLDPGRRAQSVNVGCVCGDRVGNVGVLRLHVDVQVSERTKPLSACRARARLMPLFNPLKTPMPRVSVHTSPPRLKTPNLSLLPRKRAPISLPQLRFPSFFS
jgi:hypothetical protein